jgi:flavin reductase (DIM6/NTAB) family NADH-FMN oxidoreductase RutF
MPDDSLPSPDAFKAAMRGFPGACSLITVGTGDQATGLVVTSGVSLTADPPMVLACINRATSAWAALQRDGRFGWSALGARHQRVAEDFSGVTGLRGAARYGGHPFDETLDGVRLLAEAPFAFACTVDEMLDRGTHSILIGRVREIRTRDGQGSLIYWNGTYRPMPALPDGPR